MDIEFEEVKQRVIDGCKSAIYLWWQRSSAKRRGRIDTVEKIQDGI